MLTWVFCTSEQAAEKVERRIPRGLKPAREVRKQAPYRHDFSACVKTLSSPGDSKFFYHSPSPEGLGFPISRPWRWLGDSSTIATFHHDFVNSVPTQTLKSCPDTKRLQSEFCRSAASEGVLYPTQQNIVSCGWNESGDLARIDAQFLHARDQR
ncbi:MAG: hypothetical protein WCC25_16365, partial [Candidatus Korobacteraceae bacterium]